MKRARILALVVALIAGAAATDRFVATATRSPAALAVGDPGGVLACPIVSIGSGSGGLSIANVGDGLAHVRVTWVPQRGARASRDLRLERDAAVVLSPLGAARTSSAGAIVEFSGSLVVASARSATRDSAGAVACGAPGPEVTAVGGLRTKGARASVALLNPGAADAEVSVAVHADGKVLRPLRLARRVVPARGRLAFDVGDFAFDAVRAVVVVRAGAGRVVAAGIVSSTRGYAVFGSQAPSPELVVLTHGRGAVATVAPVGLEDSAIDGRIVGLRSQGRAAGLPPLVRTGASASFALRSEEATALVVRAQAGSPMIATGTWSTGSGAGDAVGADAVPTALRWASAAGTPARLPATLSLVVANPGPEPAAVTVRFRGGTQVDRSATVPSGRVVIVPAPVGSTFGVFVTADRPVAVMLSGLLRTPPRAFAFTPAPLIEPRPVGVTVQPRGAIPIPDVAHRGV